MSPRWLVAALCVAASVAGGVAQVPKEAAPAPFRLIIENKLGSLQRSIDQASANGYVVAFGSPGYGLVVLRYEGRSEPRPAYRIVETSYDIERALKRGYRGVPRTLDKKSGRLVLIAVRTADGPFESRLFETDQTNLLRHEVRRARAAGFRVIAMTSDDGGHAALFERAAGAGKARKDPGEFVSADRQDALQEELARRAAAGYHIEQACGWTGLLLSLERGNQASQAEYRVLSAADNAMLSRDINQASREGFRYTSGTLWAIRRTSPAFGALGSGFFAIVERQEEGRAGPQYLVIGASARRLSGLTRDFDEAVARGFTPVDAAPWRSTDGQTLILLERKLR